MEQLDWKRPFIIVFMVSFFLVAVGVDLIFYSPKPYIPTEPAEFEEFFLPSTANRSDLSHSDVSATLDTDSGHSKTPANITNKHNINLQVEKPLVPDVEYLGKQVSKDKNHNSSIQTVLESFPSTHSKNKQIVTGSGGNTQKQNWCDELDPEFTNQKRHFYYTKGNTKKVVTLSTLLHATNCLLCNEVCQHLIEEQKNSNEKEKSLPNTPSWKQHVLTRLSEIVQKKLNQLQKPTSCSTAKKLLCKTESKIHYMIYCLLVSYITDRTLVAYVGRTRLSKTAWDEAFLPVSSCTRDDIREVTDLNDISAILSSKAETITIPDLSYWHYPNPDFLFLAVPEDLAFSLMFTNDEPPSWWIGQFAHYMFKVQPEMETIFQREIQSHIHSPVAAIYIRNKGKMRQDGRHPAFKSYMKHVVTFFDRINHHGPRLVYLLSDDPKGYDSLRSMYPHYTFVTDTHIGAPPSELPAKYTMRGSMYKSVHHIYLMSHCDYVVCTFSTDMCRVVYELLQATEGVKIAEKMRCKDKMYHFASGYENWEVYLVTGRQIPTHTKFLDLSPGEVVERMYTNNHPEGHWCRKDGSNKGGYVARKFVRRLWTLTKYPSFKDSM